MLSLENDESEGVHLKKLRTSYAGFPAIDALTILVQGRDHVRLVVLAAC